MNTHVLFVVGRGLIAVSFIASALGKVSKWKDTIGLMQMHQVPWPTLALFIAISIEIVGGVSLLIGTFLYPTVMALLAYVCSRHCFHPFAGCVEEPGTRKRRSANWIEHSDPWGLVLMLALNGF